MGMGLAYNLAICGIEAVLVDIEQKQCSAVNNLDTISFIFSPEASI